MLKINFDRRISSKNIDQDLEFFLVDIDLVNCSGITSKWSGNNPDGLAFFESDLKLFLFRADLLQDPLHLPVGDRSRLNLGPDEPCHSRRLPDGVPSFVC